MWWVSWRYHSPPPSLSHSAKRHLLNFTQPSELWTRNPPANCYRGKILGKNSCTGWDSQLANLNNATIRITKMSSNDADTNEDIGRQLLALHLQQGSRAADTGEIICWHITDHEKRRREFEQIVEYILRGMQRQRQVGKLCTSISFPSSSAKQRQQKWTVPYQSLSMSSFKL